MPAFHGTARGAGEVPLSVPALLRALALLASLAASGCVHQAVLENQVRSAEWKARTLATASDLELAHAALSAELVELEALYQEAPNDTRVRGLLARGYRLMAEGFVELRRLEALGSGDTARAGERQKLARDALSRAAFYGGSEPRKGSKLRQRLAPAEQACKARDRAGFERELNAVLQLADKSPEDRLELALSRHLAAAWLAPGAAATCGF